MTIAIPQDNTGYSFGHQKCCVLTKQLYKPRAFVSRLFSSTSATCHLWPMLLKRLEFMSQGSFADVI